VGEKRESTNQASLDFNGGLILSYNYDGYGFGLQDNGQLYLSKVGASAVSSSLRVTDLNFHHLAITKNGSTIYFYLDGTGVLAGAYDPGFDFTSDVSIGSRPDTGGPAGCFLGLIDEVSFYNRALSASEIQSIFGAAEDGKCNSIAPQISQHPQNQNAYLGSSVLFDVNVIGERPFSYQWQFNNENLPGATNSSLVLNNVSTNHEGSYLVLVTNSLGDAISSPASLAILAGTCVAPAAGLISWWPGNGTTSDFVGNNHGTLQGDAGYAAGKSEQGFVFDGNGDRVHLGNPASLRLTSFTLEAWVQRSSTNQISSSGTNGIVFGYSSGGYVFGLRDNGALHLGKSGSTEVLSGLKVLDTNFHHVAVTKNKYFRDLLSQWRGLSDELHRHIHFRRHGRNWRTRRRREQFHGCS
jgi:hypothetical protein